jgi:methylated-DNA-[protein]-cysteine S-methyltransferase
MNYFAAVLETTAPCGPLAVAVTETGLARIHFGRLDSLAVVMGEAPHGGSHPWLEQALQELDAYLAGKRKEFMLPIDWTGLTGFRRKVMEAALAIPYGRVCTYADLARSVGSPVGAARAAGRVMATNPIPPVVPCHRVLGTDGKLHGYAAPNGIEVKAWLLRLEGYRLVG